jgi:hypothetical protein
MGIAEQPASSADVARVGPVVRAVLVVLEDRAVQVASVVLEDLAVQVASVVLVVSGNLAVQVASVA